MDPVERPLALAVAATYYRQVRRGHETRTGFGPATPSSDSFGRAESSHTHLRSPSANPAPIRPWTTRYKWRPNHSRNKVPCSGLPSLPHQDRSGSPSMSTRIINRRSVSRDALLLAAAERARSAGCRIYVAYSDSGSLTARDPGLTTFLLPAVPASGVQAEKPPLVTIVPEVPAELSAPKAEVAKVIAQVRGMCKQQPGGGYSATDVGQALAKIGYKTPAERKRVLATCPGLRERGAHPHKLLVFQP